MFWFIDSCRGGNTRAWVLSIESYCEIAAILGIPPGTWPRDSSPKGEVREVTIDGNRLLRGVVGDLDCAFVTDMSTDGAARFRPTWLPNEKR